MIFLEEIWLSVIGFEDYYEISSEGRIRNTKGKVKVLRVNKMGYVNTSLYKHGKPYYFRVHRLVACHFIANPNNYPIINHINSVRDDNRAINLEWCNNSMNQLHSFQNGRDRNKCKTQLGKIGKLSKSSKPVIQYSLNGEFIKEWDCVADVTRQLGFFAQNISKCCIGKRETAHRYKWKFKY